MNTLSPEAGVPIVNPLSIGDILLAAGRLQPQDLQRILDTQQIEKMSFGEAAVALNILTKVDVDFALAQQYGYAYLQDNQSGFSPQLVAAHKPFSRVGENLRAVRSQLMLRWFNNDSQRKVLTVVSAGKGDGRTFTSANLAIVFAQQGQRTLLIDGDLRSDAASGQQALFKLDKSMGLSGILAGRATLNVAQPIVAMPGLSVLPAGAESPNPQELLGRMAFAQLLHAASAQFDVILIDTPNGTTYSDGEIIASRAGAALVVTRRNKTLLAETRSLGARLQDAGVPLAGVVLNDT